MLETTEKGGFRNSIRNCLTVFQCDPLLSGAIAYNMLTDRNDIIKPLGYERSTSKAVTDTDMRYIRLYLEETYGLTSEKKIADACELAAHQTEHDFKLAAGGKCPMDGSQQKQAQGLESILVLTGS